MQVGHKGSEKEIRTHRTSEKGGTKVKMKLTSRDLRMNEVHEISLRVGRNFAISFIFWRKRTHAVPQFFNGVSLRRKRHLVR